MDADELARRACHVGAIAGFQQLDQRRADDDAELPEPFSPAVAGKQRLEQKAYVMQDCDVVNFRCNK